MEASSDRPTFSFLTERQRAILDFVRSFQLEWGYAPTHREICQRFGYRSYGTVHKHLRLLREKGFLRRAGHQKRGLQVLESDPHRDPHRDSQRAPGHQARRAAAGGPRELPFLGRIAAGRPIEALPGTDTLQVPPALLQGDPARHYILRVAGSSMIEEGIHDGDFVIVQRRDRARPGEMVVALIDGEATLKRFYPEGERVRLQPANATMEPIFVSAHRLRVQGVVVGLMRKF